MSRSYNSKPSRSMHREKTVVRRQTVKRQRLVAKAAVRNGEEVPRFRGTAGWITW